jgi:hypothetical protein
MAPAAAGAAPVRNESTRSFESRRSKRAAPMRMNENEGAKARGAAKSPPGEPSGGVAHGGHCLGDRPGSHLPQRHSVEELRMGHPVVGVHSVRLHERDDHEPPPNAKRAHLEGGPGESHRPAGRGCEQRPDVGAKLPTGGATPSKLHSATGEQHKHELWSDRGGCRPAHERVEDDAYTQAPACAREDRPRHAQAGADSDGRDRGARAHPRASHPLRRRARKEQRRQREDRDKPGEDEAEPPEQRPTVAPQAPGAVDRKLCRGRTRQQVDGGKRSLELVV